MIKRAFLVDDDKVIIWMEALLACPFDVSYYVDEKKSYKSQHGVINVRAIGIQAHKVEYLDFVENLVSNLCYVRGLIKNLTKKEKTHVREIHQKNSGKICPTSGESCQCDNESCSCIPERKDDGNSPETDCDGDLSLSDSLNEKNPS